MAFPSIQRAAPVLLLIALCSCSTHTAKNPQAAQWVTENQWHHASRQADARLENTWWQGFASHQLNQLLERAQIANSDLLIAAEKMRQAQLQFNIASANLYPSLGANASSSLKNSSTGNNSFGANKNTSLGLSASYELDLWGGLAAARQAGEAQYKASVYASDAQRLSTQAAVASAWFNYLALQERIVTAQHSVEIAARLQNIVESRYRNGAASVAEVAQQKTVLLTQQASLAPLGLQQQQTQAALAILVGDSPLHFTPPQQAISQIKVPNIQAALPLQVIARRPDIANSEAQLEAASANIQQARAALFPSATPNASAGKSAAALFSLNPAVQTSGWSLNLAETLFAGGRLKNQVKIAQSKRVELLEQYHKTTLTALAEVDNALATADTSAQQENTQLQIVQQAQRSLDLTEVAYREGATDLQSLLNSQRSLFQAQDGLVQQHLARLTAAVDLYRALGGGWQLPE